ncbi:MAG: alpha/beta hydrolase [Pirellulaceae bacterium]|nr:alpha/beta hydrolase [Pirellulaceae bacterium]
MAALPVAAYGIIVIVLMFFETDLVYPGWRRTDGDWQPAGLDYRQVDFRSADGTPLVGWYLPHENPAAYVLYCHGNGDIVADCAWALDELRRDADVAVFVFDYRGYGRSAGRPDEPGVVADAEAALQWLCQTEGLKPEDVVLMGRSLGAAVAIQLAARHGARGLVLERTFTSMPDVAAHLFPWLPVRWLMRNRYHSLQYVGQYPGPVLQSHGTADQLVPFELGRRLFAAIPGPHKQFVEMPGSDHNDPDTAEYWQQLQRFLRELPPVGNG